MEYIIYMKRSFRR